MSFLSPNLAGSEPSIAPSDASVTILFQPHTSLTLFMLHQAPTRNSLRFYPPSECI